MTSFTNTISAILLAVAVFGAGVMSSTHTHHHADQSSDSVTACSCVAHQQDSDSEPPFGPPCDHEDCQLCKFLSSFGWVPSPQLDLEIQAQFQFLSADSSALIKLNVRKAYLGRAPPIV